jgi:hypothetical protein
MLKTTFGDNAMGEHILLSEFLDSNVGNLRF